MDKQYTASTEVDVTLEYLDSLISRQFEEIQLLLETKPRQKMAINRAQAQIQELMDLKSAYLSKDTARHNDILRLKTESMMFG